jgi:hypothetical protein
MILFAEGSDWGCRQQNAPDNEVDGATLQFIPLKENLLSEPLR